MIRSDERAIREGRPDKGRFATLSSRTMWDAMEAGGRRQRDELAGALMHLAGRLAADRSAGDALWTALCSLGPALASCPPALVCLSVPPPIAETWARELRATRARNILLLTELGRAIVGLASAGIASVVYKGAAAVDRLYGDPGLRPMDDADVLVRLEERERARAVLCRLGFEPVEIDRGRLGPVGATLHAAQAFRRREGALRAELDLHWEPVADARLRAAFPGVADAGFWRRIERYDLGGVSAWRLGRVDATLLTSVAQVFGHPWSHPLGYLDLHLLLMAFDGAAWGDLVAQAEALDLRAPTYWALRFAHELYGTPGAEAALRVLAPSRAARRGGDLLIRGDWIGLAPFRREMPARDLLVLGLAGPRGAVRLLGRGLVERRQDGARRLAAIDPASSARTVLSLASAAARTLAERPARD